MSTTPMKGKADFLQLGDWNAACAECGRKFKASEMRQLPAGVPGGGMWVCLPHWNMRQPQDFVRGIPEIMAAPWVQEQIQEYPLEVENVSESVDELEIVIDTAAAEAGSEPLIVNIFEGVVVGLITITDVSGGTPAASIVINNSGVVEEIVNADDVPVTEQGAGSYPAAAVPYSLVAVDIFSDGTTFGKTATLGSITPTTYAGYTVRVVQAAAVPDDPNPGDLYYVTTIQMTGGPLQDVFTTVNINGQIFISASATFSAVPISTWEWQTPTSLLTAAGTYSVEFT